MDDASGGSVQGNQPDLEAIWDRFSRRLLSFIRSRTNDDMEADDILQEVFIRVHQHLCCLPQPEKLEPWIYQISRNLIVDHYRRRKELVEVPESLPAEPDLPEEEPETELALSLQEMIDQLPEPDRQALMMSEYQRISQKEMAEQLGLSFSGAKSRVQRAREKLRMLLLACCHFELDRRGRVMDYYERCCCKPAQDCSNQ
jgi:RNA polymerase sigma-70 factor (ECF subfamily)